MSVIIILKSLSIFIVITHSVNGKGNFNIEQLTGVWNVLAYSEEVDYAFLDDPPPCIKVEILSASASSITLTVETIPPETVSVILHNPKTTSNYALVSYVTDNYTIDSYGYRSYGIAELIFYSTKFMYWNWRKDITRVTVILSRHHTLSTAEKIVSKLNYTMIPLTDQSCFAIDSGRSSDEFQFLKNWYVVAAVNGTKTLPDYKLWNISFTEGTGSVLYDVTSSAFADEEDVKKFKIELYSHPITKIPMFKLTANADSTVYYASRIDSITEDFTYWQIYEDDSMSKLAVELFLKTDATLSVIDTIEMGRFVGSGSLMAIPHKGVKINRYRKDSRKPIRTGNRTKIRKPTGNENAIGTENANATGTENANATGTENGKLNRPEASPSESAYDSWIIGEREQSRNNAAHLSNILNQSISFSFLITLIPFCSFLMILCIQSY